MTEPKEIVHITVASYAHPELYPPILSALDQLSKITETIDVVTRNTLQSHWQYPENVRLNYVNTKQYEGFEIETIATHLKIYHFCSYVVMLKTTLKKNRSTILYVHDVIPLFAAFILRKFLKRNQIKLWYHNHDVTDTGKSGNYTLMGIASKYEKKAFNYIDIFTLPSKERLEFFPIEQLQNSPIIIPNYPLERFYSQAFDTKIKTNDKVIKLVFQGSIGDGHGLEEIIGILDQKINGKCLELHLVGKLRETYLKKLQALVAEKNVASQFEYHGMKPFAKLPFILSQFDIGIAIHKPYNVTYATGGTASNKIYEYAACGMPVLLFDSEHYRSYLGERPWTFFTNLTKESLMATLETIDSDITKFSELAYSDFQSQFNFETVFQDRFIPLLKNIV